MKIYNTLLRKKEPFIPVEENKAKIYVCGPTVYNYIHIGNARPLVVFDTLRRYFLYKGMDVDYIQNFTDIDDKIINRALEEGVDFCAISEKYIQAYLDDAHSLNVLEEHTVHPKATEYIGEMIDFIQGLIDKGAAYAVDGDVYFDVSKAKNYGNLSKKDIEDLQSGARIDINEQKKNPLDFALWKKKKTEKEPSWESPWSNGRPGWHIECSVMARSLLGDTIDIHAGGADLQFPHHENEIAQSETLTGKPFSNYWMHNAMIMMDQEKMSKSLGNIRTIYELRQEYDMEAVRFWLLSAHYRNPINFSQDVMEQAQSGLERLYNARKKLSGLLSYTLSEGEVSGEGKKALQEFEMAMEDDLNTADAISAMFNLVRFINQEVSDQTPKEEVEDLLKTLQTMGDVLGILWKKDETSIDDSIQALIDERQEARKNKNFARADEIRDELQARGIQLKDTAQGVVWSRTHE